MENIRISSPAEDFRIYFNYDPQSAYTDQNGVRHNVISSAVTEDFYKTFFRRNAR